MIAARCTPANLRRFLTRRAIGWHQFALQRRLTPQFPVEQKLERHESCFQFVCLYEMFAERLRVGILVYWSILRSHDRVFFLSPSCLPQKIPASSLRRHNCANNIKIYCNRHYQQVFPHPHLEQQNSACGSSTAKRETLQVCDDEKAVFCSNGRLCSTAKSLLTITVFYIKDEKIYSHLAELLLSPG